MNYAPTEENQIQYTGLSFKNLRRYLNAVQVNLQLARLADDTLDPADYTDEADCLEDGHFVIGYYEERLADGETQMSTITGHIETCGKELRVSIYQDAELNFTTRLEKVGGYWYQVKRVVGKYSTASTIADKDSDSTWYDISSEKFLNPFQFARRYFVIRFPSQEPTYKGYDAVGALVTP